jgi:hypothetical protein
MTWAVLGENAVHLPVGYDGRSSVATDDLGNIFVVHPDLKPIVLDWRTGEWGFLEHSHRVLPPKTDPVRTWGFWGAAIHDRGVTLN